MSDIKEMITRWAKEPYIEHEDYNKCGLCLKNKIQSQVANEFLEAGKLSAENLTEMFNEIDRRFKETELYKRVQSMLKSGKTIEQVAAELLKEGIDI
jgi:hypothetical protein